MPERNPHTYVELSKRSAVLDELYPDVKERGLPAVIQDELTRIGSALSVDTHDLPEGFPAYARVDASGRSSQVYVAASHRLFLIDFWSKGIELARGQTPCVDLVASAIDHWITNQSSSAKLSASFPFVSPTEGATDFEQGRATERAWKLYLQHVTTDLPELAEFIRLAYETPKLRQLFPFTSMSRFCFSRCTGYPYTMDCPVVWSSSKDGHTVSVPEGGAFSGLGAAEAIELVLRNLPKNVGPAVDGTAENLPT